MGSLGMVVSQQGGNILDSTDFKYFCMVDKKTS